jgi:hypothetical protein
MSTRRCPADIWLFCGFPFMRRQAGLETSLATTANGRKKLDPKTATVAPYGHWGRYFAIRKSRLALLDRRRRLSGLLQLVSACESVKTGQLCSAAVQLGRIWNAVTTRFSKNIARVVNRQLCAVCRIKMSKTDQSLASVAAILLESANTRCVPARSTDALQCNEQALRTISLLKEEEHVWQKGDLMSARAKCPRPACNCVPWWGKATVVPPAPTQKASQN